jgi:hypothetical protein
MSGSGCLEAMALLNIFFTTAMVLNDGHEVLARLEAGEDVAEICDDYCTKLGREDHIAESRWLLKNWPPLHMEVVTQLVRWALGKLDTDDRITIHWKGDVDSPETVTRFELKGHDMIIEFAHPPSLVA